MKIEIKPYKDEYWAEFVKLVNKYWSKEHPITNKELFNWQYKGFGHSDNFQLFKVLFVDGAMEGFRGVIPGLYHTPGSSKIHKGGTFAMWLVTPNFRGTGLGYKLMQEIEQECSILMSVGSTLKTSGRIYAKNNFTYLSKFHRWVVGFDNRYKTLLRNNVSNLSFNAKVTHNNCEIDPDPLLFESIWLNYARHHDFFSLYRTRDFWQWRYVDSPGYKYYYFSNDSNDLIVGRIESGITRPNSNDTNLKIFRFIEIVQTKSHNTLQSLISDVLGWAIKNDCCGADFQASTPSFDECLIPVGFCKQEGDYGSGACSLAGLFNPFQFKPEPINAFWRVLVNGEKIDVDSNQAYLMKSDNDMDRPNHWPIVL